MMCALTVPLAIRTTCSRVRSLPMECSQLGRLKLFAVDICSTPEPVQTRERSTATAVCSKILEQYKMIRVLDSGGVSSKLSRSDALIR